MESNYYELTNPQKNIWNTEMYYSNTNVNNICASSIFGDDVNIDLLKQAINILVQKHDSFRIKLTLKNSVPMQCFEDFVPFDIDVKNIKDMDEFQSLEEEIVSEQFKLIGSPLYKFVIVKFDNGKVGVILNVHHMIGDSWSMGYTVQEIIKLYNLLKNKESLDDEIYSYKDFIASEQKYAESNRFNSDKDFWESNLKNLPNPVTLPSLSSASSNESSAAERASFTIDKNIMNSINAFCSENKISTYIFFMSIFSIYLGNLCNTDDVLLGTPIINRLNFREKQTTGMFVTTIPFRIQLTDGSFIDFAQKNNISLMSTLRHQKYSYSDIIEDVRKENPDMQNLYNVALSYQITKADKDKFGEYEGNWTFNHNCLNDINIHLMDFNETGNLDVNYDYLTSKYSASDIENHHERIMAIINQVISNPEMLVKDVEVITEKEKFEILKIFNDRKLKAPLDSNVIALFEKQVEEHPETAAVTYKNVTLTYGELNTKVNQFARFLQTKGIQKGDIVGVYMNKTEWFIVSILALQKLGAAYAPMHPEYPLERVSYILEDCKSKILITDKENVELPYPQFNPQNVDTSSFDSSNLNIDISSDNLCYVIYTSGSTGKPKGVLLTHKNLINFLYNFNESFDSHFTIKDSCLSLTNISFDVSVSEIFSALSFGARLVLYPDNTIDNLQVLAHLLEDEKITYLYLPPNILKDFYEFIKKENIKFIANKLLVGVEAIKNQDLNNLLSLNPELEIVNGYGPTETTICITFFKYRHNDKLNGIVPIGYPLKNNNLFVINSFNNLLPVGIPGELIVTGSNVSKGYMNNVEKTKQSFVNIDKYNELFYKTGDNVYWDKNGFLNFIGRQDSQVKFRGHRIELTEINNNIKNIDGVTNSITQLKEVNGILALCSYVETQAKLDENAIKLRLSSVLPYYMMPTHIVIMKKLPVNNNGKIDKKSLPDIKLKSYIYVAPSTENEKYLSEKICKLLNLDKVSIDSDFFNIGLDSLSAIRLSAEIYNDKSIDLNIKNIFENNTIRRLGKLLDSPNLTVSDSLEIKKAKKANYYPLSFAQKRIYFASKMIGENNLVYNLPLTLTVDTILDKNKVEDCFNKIIKTQNIFRTSFIMKNNKVVQQISENTPFKIETFNMQTESLSNILERFIRPFDLSNAPLLRVAIGYTNDNKSILLIDSHHIIMDGESLLILLKTFCNLYNGSDISTPLIDYKDYSIWNNNDYLNSDKFKLDENYWISKFKGKDIPSLNLPYDYNIPSVRNYEGKTISHILDQDTFNKYINYCKKHNVSPYMFFISALFILLYKYSGQDEIFLGSPALGRDNNELKNLIGMFVNNIVLDVKINPGDNFVDFMNLIKDQSFNCLTHQNYPFDMLVKNLGLSGDTSRNPIFDVMFIYQNNSHEKFELNNHTININSNKPNISKFNLSVEILPNYHMINVEYCTSLFKKETINNFINHYLNTLNFILKNDNPIIKSIEIISSEEKDLILNNFNNTSTNYPRNNTVIQLFEEQVKNNPNKIALVFENKELTYLELNQKANQLANYLYNLNINNEDIISIFLDKSIEMIISILAILKVGCAYLPIDTSYPKDRIDYILKNSNSKVMLSSTNIQIPNDLLIKTIYVDLNNAIFDSDEKENLFYIGKPNDLAYIMYTSGSTGKPKGVMIENKSIVRLVKNTNYINFNDNDRILQTGSIVFDACTFEIWGALLNGLRLYIIKKQDLLDAITFKNYLKDNKITILWLTAPLFNQLVEEDPYMFEHVRCLLTGGDVLSCTHVNLVRKCNPNITVINGYGPTENTTFSCCYPITKKYKKSIPVGFPIANSTGYVMSVDGNLQPIGIPGELWVGGDGVARGYLNRPELTFEKFIQNPFYPGRIYKTGDLVKWCNDGTIQFIGRIDGQVKIRGYRVELSEITAIIDQNEEIKEAYTVVKNVNNEKTICSYIIGKKNIDIDQLKQYLSAYLPTYMIPKYIIQLKKLPKNQNGKVDKQQLPDIDTSNVIEREIINPQNETQEKLLSIYKKILNTNRFSIEDNFFEYGGDSINAMTLQVEALKENLHITYGDVFKYPTIKSLSEYIDNINNNSTNNEIYENSDFYNNIISKNTVEQLVNNPTIPYTPIGNVLLSGVTGFLGAHILDSYLKNESGNIYCLIRPKNYMQPSDRLKETLHFYFGEKYDKLINSRIICVEGDITQKDLGLSKTDYDELGNNIDTVIHSAALVKHFGNYLEFEKININGTKNIIEFCQNFNTKLIHISTTSVSGNSFADGSYSYNEIQEDIDYSENKFYIGQSLENLYVKSKFMAEKEVLNAISKGLKAYICRMGNLTSRYSEGKFQQNHLENAFVNRIKTFLQIRCIPDYMYTESIEFTPIDYCGDAIIKLANHYDSNFSVFHLLNDNRIKLKDFGQYLKDFGIDFKVLSSEEFSNLITELLNDPEKSKTLQGIIRDLNSDKKLIYESNIHIQSKFSKEFLKKIDFEWPIIDKNYIKKYLEYLIDIGYLNLKLTEDK